MNDGNDKQEQEPLKIFIPSRGTRTGFKGTRYFQLQQSSLTSSHLVLVQHSALAPSPSKAPERRRQQPRPDLIDIKGDPRKQAPKNDPQYYYRPYKTILVRTVADGGESFYVSGDHRQTVPTLRARVLQAAERFS